MRLLVLNPNTSQFVTDRVVETARAAAGPECRVTGVTGRRGPPIVGTRSECAMAAAEALDEYVARREKELRGVSLYS